MSKDGHAGDGETNPFDVWEVQVKAARLRIGAIATAAAMVAALLAMTVGAGSASARPAAKNPLSKDGVIYACYKVKGKERGALRVVRHPRACRKLRGWHRTAWSAIDSFGVSGQHGAAGANGGGGPPGPQGAPGQSGEPGQQGVAGTVEQSLIETIQTQSLQIDELTEQVTTLTGDVTVLGETVEDVCGQVSDVTEQTDLLAGVIGGISLDTLLAVLLEVPPLPAALGEYDCA